MSNDIKVLKESIIDCAEYYVKTFVQIESHCMFSFRPLCQHSTGNYDIFKCDQCNAESYWINTTRRIQN